MYEAKKLNENMYFTIRYTNLWNGKKKTTLQKKKLAMIANQQTI